MKSLSYNELLQKYKEVLHAITELNETIEDKDWKIDLLQTTIEELEDILYETGIFKHYDFD